MTDLLHGLLVFFIIFISLIAVIIFCCVCPIYVINQAFANKPSYRIRQRVHSGSVGQARSPTALPSVNQQTATVYYQHDQPPPYSMYPPPPPEDVKLIYPPPPYQPPLCIHPPPRYSAISSSSSSG